MTWKIHKKESKRVGEIDVMCVAVTRKKEIIRLEY